MNGRSDRAVAILDELPAGTIELGRRYVEAAKARLETLGERGPADSSAGAVADHLVRPIELADDWPDPTDPLPVGDGAVHADLIDDDRDLFATLRATVAELADDGLPAAEALAAQAQACRLPVTPYRRRSSPHRAEHRAFPRVTDLLPPDPQPRDERPIAGRLVVDLSALWAGPLATALLTEVGVEVVKIDPSCRPDAFAEHPRLYAHLNNRKEIVDLDLRVDDDRARFEELVRSADLVVDSFSRRVMPNLGYGPRELRALHPSVASLSISAFDSRGPYADWVAYGPGVHAMSGLAVKEAERESVNDVNRRAGFRAAPIAYPDALAGLAAFAAAVHLLAISGPSSHHTVSLAGAIEPLQDGDLR